MKKIMTLAFALTAFVALGTVANAQTNNSHGRQFPQNERNRGNSNRVVRTYNETKTVWLRGDQYRETYQITVFRNGRTTSKLINRVKIENDRHHGVWTSYETKRVKKGRYFYQETYQIKHLPNGRTQSKLVKSVRVR
ncbi:MAG: hypothetical protein R2747_23905 [Pyrinomonadaceae bacterium]